MVQFFRSITNQRARHIFLQPPFQLKQGQGPYAKDLRKLENDIKDAQKRVNEKIGVKESDTGLAPPSLWDIPADKQRMGEEQPLQASRPIRYSFPCAGDLVL